MVQRRIILNSPGFLRNNEPFRWLITEKALYLASLVALNYNLGLPVAAWLRQASHGGYDNEC
jgi:hypothetical protein